MQNIYKELAIAMEDYTGLEVNNNLRSFSDYVGDTVKVLSSKISTRQNGITFQSVREQINERIKNRTDQMQAFTNKLKSRRSKVELKDVFFSKFSISEEARIVMKITTIDETYYLPSYFEFLGLLFGESDLC